MYANLNNTGTSVINANDSIVIVDNFQSIRGGSTLDVTNFGPDTIKAGHVIIKETSTGNYKPMPLATNDTVYDTLPVGHTYAGILIASILKAKPFAGILVRGTVNHLATPFSMTAILSAVKTALPLIDFRAD
ncbi:hypothetical protein [Pedobacter sp. Leaf170]|uniref:hypothetical protein n=1 Tax=Pedobacter sp. Leaf170 TaxID=2876558 RepID=UPI001E35C50A|nr:hypothetical protein [Pedobacter sp. Leaf170]